MNSISFNYLHDEIFNNELSLGDSVYEFLDPDIDRAKNIFARQVRGAIREYDKHYPLVMTIELKGITQAGYEFRDNFEAYLAGNIKEEEIELVPESIAVVRSGWNILTSNNYEYRKPLIKCYGGATRIKYYTFHPYRYTMSPEGGFTEDSKVYYISEDDDTFINLVTYNILNQISTIRNSVQQPTGLTFFDFNNRLQELRASINDDFATSGVLYNSWS